jgi:hypothetical protein
MKGVVRFGKKRKLNPWFIEPFKVTERVSLVAYRVSLPPDLAGVHDVFHVSTLWKYIHDPLHVLSYKRCKSKETWPTKKYLFISWISRSKNCIQRKSHLWRFYGESTGLKRPRESWSRTWEKNIHIGLRIEVIFLSIRLFEAKLCLNFKDEIFNRGEGCKA